MIGLCPVCEEKHGLKVLNTGVDGNLRFIVYRCPITNVTFELFKPIKNKKLKEKNANNN